MLLAGAGWILQPVIWRAWLAHLYGVETWDLRLVLRVCRALGMREQPTSAIVEARDMPKPS